MDPGFLERGSYVKMFEMCVCVCVCGRFVCGHDFIYFFLKYPMKMKSFGVT